jgi:hypothetical protein
MTDTSNADNSPDANWKDGTAQWTPPPGAPSPLAGMARRAAPQPDPSIWQRGQGKTPDQPTTVANLSPQPAPPPQALRPPAPAPPQTMRPKPMPWTAKPPLHQASPPGTPQLSPTGRPPPLRQYSPYVPAQPIRTPDAWGTEAPFARQPQTFEVPGIFHGVGGFFGGNGSGITALLGSGLVKNSAAFMKSYMQGREFASKEARDDMQNHALELELKQKEETDAYAEIFNAYDAVGYKALNGTPFDVALTTVAQKYNDQNMIGALANGPGAAYQLMKNRDSHWQDVQAANKTSNKEAQDAKDLADWGVPGASATDAQPTPSLASTARPHDSPAAPPDPNAPSPQAQPVSASQPETQGDRINALPDYAQKGIEYLRGGKMEGVPKAVQPHVVKYANDTLSKMDDLVARSRDGKMSKEQIEEEMRKINPAIAGEFADIRDLNAPLPGGMGAINAQPFWRDISSLAASSVPGWRVNDYAVTGEMQRDYTTGTSSRRMQAANNMADAAVPVLKALKNIPEGATPPQNWASEIIAKKFTGDPRWVTLFNTMQQYIQESQSLASPTGKYFEGDVNRMMKEFDVTQGTSVIRSVLSSDADAATRRIATLTDDWQNTTHKDLPPHYNPKSTDILKAISQLDPDKGFADVPNLPPDLQGLGMGRTETPPSGGGAAAPATPPPDPGWTNLR